MENIEVPHSFDSECYLLGAIIRDNQLYYEVAKEIERGDFFNAVNGTIFDALGVLIHKHERVDEFSLGTYLKEQKILESMGGMSFISSLMDYVDSLELLRSRIDIVKRKSIRRQLIGFSQIIKDNAIDESKEVEDTLSDIQNRIIHISSKKRNTDLVHIKYVIEDVYKKIEKLSKKEIKSTGISTGFTEIDQKTMGLHPQTLTVIGARPSMGKTAFCLNMAYYIATVEKVPVALFSLEMSIEEIILRFLASGSEIELSWLKGGFLLKNKFNNIGKVVLELSKADIFIDDSPLLTPVEIYSKLHKVLSQNSGLKVVFIDYLQLMSGDKGKRFESKNIEITEITRTLKAIAKEFNVAVVALSQLSRASEKRKGRDIKPKLSDLRESGAIEQDADLVMFIHRPEYYDRENESLKGLSEIIIAKQRNGPLGTVELVFRDKFTQFSNKAAEYYEQQTNT